MDVNLQKTRARSASVSQVTVGGPMAGQSSTVPSDTGVATGQWTAGGTGHSIHNSVHTQTVTPLHTTDSSTLCSQDVLENHSQRDASRARASSSTHFSLMVDF